MFAVQVQAVLETTGPENTLDVINTIRQHYDKVVTGPYGLGWE